MKMVAVRFVWVVAAAAGLGLAGGCAHPLFTDTYHGRDNIGRYYEGDSAVQATESRKQAGQMGFGFPTGPEE